MTSSDWCFCPPKVKNPKHIQFFYHIKRKKAFEIEDLYTYMSGYVGIQFLKKSTSGANLTHMENKPQEHTKDFQTADRYAE